MKKKKKNNTISLDIVSKYKTEIYGIAILWIVIFHGLAINSVNFSFNTKILLPLHYMINLGNIGVDIFLFLSGITLYYSYHKNPDIYSFIKKRFFRLMLPVLIINGLYWFVRFVLIEGSSIFMFIDRILLLRFWHTGDQAIWFVSLIAILYLIYPYIYNFLSSNKGSKFWLRSILLLSFAYLFVICLALSNNELYDMTEIATTRIPVFILGCILGQVTYKKKKINKKFIIPIVLILIGFSIIMLLEILTKYQIRFLYLVGGVCLTYIFAFLLELIEKIKISNYIKKFLSFFGNISLELYLSHITINQIYRLTPLYQKGDLLGYTIVIILSILTAWLTSKLITIIKNKSKLLTN